jgi:hypothetical protein
MALRGTPITIQVSPSTYLLMTKLADLCVDYSSGTNLQIKSPGIQTAIDTLYKALVAANPSTTTTDVELTALQTAGLTEAQNINDNAGYEVVMAC